MKLKTKIIYSFDLETSMDDIYFTIESKNPKKKTKIIEVKKYKNKIDVSTRLF